MIGEDESWLPYSLTSLRTKSRRYKYGLWNGKGRVGTWEVREILTTIPVTITFFWLTIENVTILSEYPDEMY